MYFQSLETLQTISVNSVHSVKIPQPMPNDDFTLAFIDASDDIGTVSKATMAGSLAINLLSSSSLSTLWGLINCLQIVAHFPLINIVQPANSRFVFHLMQ